MFLGLIFLMPFPGAAVGAALGAWREAFAEE
jgi:uncharacterized membrane protein